MSFTESSEAVGVRQNIDTSGHRHVHIAFPQCLASNLDWISVSILQYTLRVLSTAYFDRCKPRGAGCVNAVAWTGEFEKVVDTPGTKCTAPSRNVVSANFLTLVDFTVVVRSLAVEDTNTL